MKTILLTGATGFVGSQILKTLLTRNVCLRVIVRKGKESFLPTDIPTDWIIITQDLFSETPEWFAQKCEGVDTVVHSAWYTEPGKYLQSALNFECLIGTLKFAKGAARSNIKRFIGVGTCFEYDLTKGILSTDTPLKPTTPYASAKTAVYLALSQWLPTQTIQFAWCRLFYLYGEGEDKRRLVPYLRSRLEAGEVAELTSGKQIRDFMDVQEAGRRIAEIALSERQGAINICSGIPVSVRQLVEQIADEYNRRDLLKFGSREDNLVDPPCVLGIDGF